MAKKYTLAELLPAVTDMPVTHPAADEVLGFTMKVQGGFTPTLRQKTLEAMAWLQSAQKEQKPLELARLVMSAEEALCEAAAMAIKGWSEDAPFEEAYSPDYATRLMRDPNFAWLRTQINTFVSKESNFFRKVGDGPRQPDNAGN